MRVNWTENAVGHLSAIHDYIAQDSLLYARSMVDRLTSRSQQLGDFDVLAVIHAARRLPADPPR